MVDVLGHEDEVVRRAEVQVVDHVEVVDDLRAVALRGVAAEDARHAEVGLLAFALLTR